MSGLRLIGRLVALIIIFVLVVITPPLILAYNVQEAAVNGDFLDELVQDPRVFEEAIPEMADDMATSIRRDLELRNEPIAQLDAQEWEQILYAVVPPDFMQEWAQGSIDSLQTSLRRGGRFLEDIVLPFGEIRDNIVNDPEQTVLRTITAAQLACSDGQEPLGAPNDLIPQCQPSESRLEAFYDRLSQQWQEQPRDVWQQLMPDTLDRYPDNISIPEFVEAESGEQWWEARMGWRATRWGLQAARWILALYISIQCIAALGIVALLAARNWREALRWTGSPLTLIGIFTLLLALAVLVGAEATTWAFFDPEIPRSVQDALADTVHAFSGDVWPSMLWQGGVLVILGVGLWILSFLVPGERKLAPGTNSTPPDSPVGEAPSESDLPAEAIEGPVLPKEHESPTHVDSTEIPVDATRVEIDQKEPDVHDHTDQE